MFIFLIYFLALRWGNVSYSNVTMKYAQLHCFASQNIGGTKYIMSPLYKSWWTCLHAPHKLGPFVVGTKLI